MIRLGTISYIISSIGEDQPDAQLLAYELAETNDILNQFESVNSILATINKEFLIKSMNQSEAQPMVFELDHCVEVCKKFTEKMRSHATMLSSIRSSN